MGRPRVHVTALETGYPAARGWPHRYKTEWGIVVGDRVRRLRRSRDLTLRELAEMIVRPDGGHYHGGYMSRLERGYSFAPLYTYVVAADALGIEAGRLLGPDDVQREVSEAEHMLLRFLRDAGVTPHDALGRLARVREAT
jgi:transcriptional regulator with XRE-family HTH domain